MCENRQHYVKWLRVLMYLAIVALVISVLEFVPFIPAALRLWISRAITVALPICLHQVATVNKRYKKAAILRGISLVFIGIALFVKASAGLALISGIFLILAEYQEYHGHSEAVADADAALSGKWSSLFTWSILAGLVLGFTSFVVVFLAAVAQMKTTDAAMLAAVLLSIPDCVIDVLYILYLKQMVRIFSDDPVVRADNQIPE